MDVCEGGRERGERGVRKRRELAFSPFHDDENAVDVAIYTGEETRKLIRQRFETLAELVEFSDNQWGRGHVCQAHTFAKIPDCDPGFLEFANLFHTVFRVEE